MRQVLELHAASPVPRAVELLGSPGLELAGVTLALRAEPRAGDWWVRLHVQTPSGWTRVGELVTRALRTTGESPVLLATAAIPGATGWRLEAWPRLAALSNDRATLLLDAGQPVGTPGLRVNDRWAELVGERARVTGAQYPSSPVGWVQSMSVPAGGRLRSWSLWSVGASGASAVLTNVLGGATTILCPPNGAVGGSPELIGPCSIEFQVPANVDAASQVEWVE